MAHEKSQTEERKITGGSDQCESTDESQRRPVASDRAKPSDEYVLNFAFFSFIAFVAFQSAFALMANSQSMLADSEAMSIDAITYLLNAGAERMKSRRFSEDESEESRELREYRQTMNRLYLELVPPSLSVAALIVITVYTVWDSVASLTAPYDENDNGEDDVSISIMLIFSSANLLLDLLNVMCFARSDSAFGIRIIHYKENFADHQSPHKTCEVESCETDGLVTLNRKENYSSFNEMSKETHKEGAVNLNMCSAWTHVCADTMRSLTVVVVASIATLFPSIDGNSADSVAAIIVSFVIIVSLVPLLHGLVLTAQQIVLLRRRHPETKISS